MLFNGDLVISGGNDEEKTSIYRLDSGTWEIGPEMQEPRGYQASVTLSTGQVRHS